MGRWSFLPANFASCSSVPMCLQEGYGVNTFKLINAEGQENLCKFHVLPKEGGIACPEYHA